MFGHHKRKREKKRLKKERADLEKQKQNIEAGSPQREKEHADYQKSKVAEDVIQAKDDRKKAREEGRIYAEDVLNRDVEGLDPAKRQAMQFEANKGIQRSMQSANRKLLGEQSQHGIVGKGGVGYAQQRDLNKMGMEAQAGVHRDLDKLNSDLALKKIAAMFNIEQGEASQAQLDKQLAIDEMKLNDERKRQRIFEDQYNRMFTRV